MRVRSASEVVRHAAYAARAALAARAQLTAGVDEDFYRAKIATARFYAEQILPERLVRQHQCRHVVDGDATEFDAFELGGRRFDFAIGGGKSDILNFTRFLTEPLRNFVYAPGEPTNFSTLPNSTESRQFSQVVWN